MTYRIEAHKQTPRGYRNWVEVGNASSQMMAEQTAMLYSSQHPGRPVRVFDTLMPDEPTLEINKDQIR